MCTDTTVKGKGTATKTSKKKSTVASMRKSIAPSVITIEGIPYSYCVFHHQCRLYLLRSHLFLFADPESEDDGVCCECKNSVDDVHWVACDECNSWYHLSCTDLDESPGPDDVWICTLCSDI